MLLYANIAIMRVAGINILFVFSILMVSCTDHKPQNYTVAETNSNSGFIAIPDAKIWDPAWSTENKVVYQVLQEPDNLHPTNGKTLMRSEVMLYTQSVLIGTNFMTNTLKPNLLSKLPLYDAANSSYKFHLRNDALWDNGEHLTANDILFTLKVYKCVLTQNDFFKPYLDNMIEFIPDSNDSFAFSIKIAKLYLQDVAIWGDIIIMQQSFHDPKNILGKYLLATIAAEDFRSNAPQEIKNWFEEFNSEATGFDLKKLNGLGPYKVTAWEHGQFLTLEKKSNHWTDHSKDSSEHSTVAKIIFKINSDPNVNVLEFKKQQFDASTTLATKSLLKLREDSLFNHNYNAQFTSTFNYSFAAFNMKPDGKKHNKIFDNLNVRKAISMLFPYEQINRALYKGEYKRQAGPVCSHKYNFNESLTPILQNYNEAIKLIANAGWKDSDHDGVLDKMIDGIKEDFKFDMNIYSGIPDWNDLSLLLAAELKKAGIVMNIVPLEVPVFLEKARTHDFDMLMSVWTTNVSPDDFTQLWHSSSWSENGDNYSGFGNSTSDALIDSIKFTIDDSLRTAMDKRFQKMVVDDVAYVFLFNSQRRIAVHKRFGNVNLYFEKPGLLLNTFRLLSPVNKTSATG